MEASTESVEKMTEWWKTFFQGVALDFWRAVVTDEQTRAEADFIQKHLLLSSGAMVLDVPCGNGRLSLELARRGFRLTAVDIAAEFIEEARTKSGADGLEIDLRNSDMRDLPWNETFHGAFCFGNSFGYLSDQGNADFLLAVSRTLRPGSRFIIESGAIAECILPVFQPHRSFEIGGITLEIDSVYNHELGRIFTNYTFIRDGHRDKRPASQRVYSYSELCRLMRTADLNPISAYSSADETPFTLGVQKLLLVCQKLK
jgi:SAM-dependent methyltransferase